MTKYKSVNRYVEDIVVLATLSADNTPAAIDVRGYRSVQVLVGVGIGGITFDATNKIEIKLRHGDGTVGNHTAVASTDVSMPSGYSYASGGIIRNLIAAHASPTWIAVDYIGQNPANGYVSVLVDFSGTHGTGTPLCIIVRKGGYRTNPPV